MLCLSGFELYSRQVPLLKLWPRFKKRFKKNAFGDVFRRQKYFAEKMEAIWTNSFKIRGNRCIKTFVMRLRCSKGISVFFFIRPN